MIQNLKAQMNWNFLKVFSTLYQYKLLCFDLGFLENKIEIINSIQD